MSAEIKRKMDSEMKTKKGRIIAHRSFKRLGSEGNNQLTASGWSGKTKGRERPEQANTQTRTNQNAIKHDKSGMREVGESVLCPQGAAESSNLFVGLHLAPMHARRPFSFLFCTF